MGCCSNSPECELLMMFHTKTQKVEVSQKLLPPPGWNPKVANEVLFTNFPPYHYQPTPGIPYTNRAGQTNITAYNEMNNQGGYFSNTIQVDSSTSVAKMY